MGCTRRPWLLSKYLEMAFTPDSGIRKQDALTVFNAIANNDVGRQLAWVFLQDHWDDIYDFVERVPMRMIRSACRKFKTEHHLKELVEFYEAHSHQLPHNALDMAQLLEEVTGNVAWLKNHYDEVLAWLESQGHAYMLPSH
uniref:ERAP1-like C-terminal domain-containing protein n=2 Tax=Scylla TaxID=6760 RepID=A0A0P4W4X1_SCYOL